MICLIKKKKKVILNLCSIAFCSQMEDSEGTVRQIGAFSEGIQNLTVRTRNNYSLIIVSTASDSKLNAFLSFTRAC